jgi:hypothetical protein
LQQGALRLRAVEQGTQVIDGRGEFEERHFWP